MGAGHKQRLDASLPPVDTLIKTSNAEHRRDDLHVLIRSAAGERVARSAAANIFHSPLRTEFPSSSVTDMPPTSILRLCSAVMDQWLCHMTIGAIHSS